MSGGRISSTVPLCRSEILNRRNVLNTKPGVCFADCGNQQIENRNQIGLETANGKSKADARDMYNSWLFEYTATQSETVNTRFNKRTYKHRRLFMQPN